MPADDLIRSIRAAPALLGNGGQARADIGLLCDTLPGCRVYSR